MDESIKQIDVGTVIEALSYNKAHEVWKEYCETDGVFEERIYWRGVFFEAMNKINPNFNLSLPTGKEFAQICVEFAEPFSN